MLRACPDVPEGSHVVVSNGWSIQWGVGSLCRDKSNKVRKSLDYEQEFVNLCETRTNPYFAKFVHIVETL